MYWFESAWICIKMDGSVQLHWHIRRHTEIGSCSYCNSGIHSNLLPLWGGLSDRAPPEHMSNCCQATELHLILKAKQVPYGGVLPLFQVSGCVCEEAWHSETHNSLCE